MTRTRFQVFRGYKKSIERREESAIHTTDLLRRVAYYLKILRSHSNLYRIFLHRNIAYKSIIQMVVELLIVEVRRLHMDEMVKMIPSNFVSTVKMLRIQRNKYQ